MDDDDAAHKEIDGWIQENKSFAEKGGGAPSDVLNTRIHTRLDTVKKAYQDFLQRNPNYARAHLAYGSFIENNGDEEGGADEYEKARQVDPEKIPRHGTSLPIISAIAGR